MTYRDAGVDIDAGDALVENIKPFAARTRRDGVLAGIGGFGALFEVPKRYREPVLVSGTDGVGTKLKLAFALDRHDTIGIDLVAMSVNDVLVQGAEPLFFLDYYATGRLDVAVATRVVKGIAYGCELAGCALIGGETAEMPGMYAAGEYDLAGFCVGVVEKSRIIDGSKVAPGDLVLGVHSNGLHSNGYSLARRIVEHAAPDLDADFHGAPFAEALIAPTRIYVKPVLALLATVPVKALAHITGGGLPGNLPRVLRAHLSARLDARTWQRPPLFDWLQAAGNVTDAQMYTTFNCGIGMAVVVAADDAERAIESLTRAGEHVDIIGAIHARRDDEPQTSISDA
ncbi:MAG: phosphoribosylformylglycinamidine cyclo-ligase [Proteobacteria bacterium]|nr:phosphoribosylformylglycinamidine cyclo-ligase [Burkholderiales bacterium]